MNISSENIVQDKSFNFALEIVELCRRLIEERKEFVLSKQLLKSGTSIGANIEEAQSAESKQDFIHKMSIALKEARESKYWLRLITQSKYAKPDETSRLLMDIEEIISLLVSIIKSARGST